MALPEGFITASTGVGGADFVQLVGDLCNQYKGKLRVDLAPKEVVADLAEDEIHGDNLYEVDEVFVFYEVT